MENANWVISTQNLLLLIGVVLWHLPKKDRAGATFKLPLWKLKWWDGAFYLLLLALGMATNLGSVLLPCIAFFVFREIYQAKYDAPLNTRTMSIGAIGQSAVVNFLCHWPILFLVYWISSTLLYNAEPQKSIEVLRSGSWEKQFEIALLALLIAPVTEELFFRAILYRVFKSLLSAGPAMVLTSFAFAAVHQNLFAFAPLFTLSFFLILVYERTGHLAVPILYHALFNSLTVIFVIWGNA
tara:strand:+ start:12675 stop:13394 length:720 start_codon:yes stop_codon:yes gene_type:complete